MLNTIRENLTTSQLTLLRQFGDKIGRLGRNFAVFTRDGRAILQIDGGRFHSVPNRLADCAGRLFDHYPGNLGADGGIRSFCGDGLMLAAALTPTPTHKRHPEPVAAAVLDLGPAVDEDDPDHRCLVEMLAMLCETFSASAGAERQMDKIGAELAHTYEELVLLHKLGMNMKVTEADTNFLQMACDSLTEIVLVEGIAILLPRIIDDAERLTVAAGSGIIEVDERMANLMYSRLVDELNAGREALLDSEVDTPFTYDWPETLQSVIAVPLYGKGRTDSQYAEQTVDGNTVVGLMVAVNRIDKDDFDSIDIKLFNSVANGCAVFIDNGRLFRDLKELFLGSLMALTSSIDAKDQYTRGHSERVAFISHWIAERVAESVPLDADQVNKVYLAGLLHDIGKIGVDESVLRKTGPLSEAERQRIKAHPAIGAAILQAIPQMRDIVPGVLCHHERMDGLGYPQGLTADTIPLIGKIIQLADTFDAMTSRRTYRDALPVEKAIAEIERGLGTQFDAQIGRIFLDSNIDALWNIIRDGFGEIHGLDHLNEYGNAAVGTLIR